jgi:benzodiazapine receptor
MKRDLKSDLPSLAVWLLITFAAGALGAVATSQAPEFYQGLMQPSWAPPSWLFGPVWSTLYVLMGIAVWLVWRSREAASGHGPYVLYVVQLVANALWSWIFFAWHRGQWAFIEVLVLLALIIATMFSFARINRSAAWLLAPYAAWTAFASLLTYTVWQLNPDLL